MGRFGLQREPQEEELGIRDTPPPESNSYLGTGPPAGGLTDIVKLLLEKGANVQAKSDDGTTALKLATDHGKTEVVKLLQEKGAQRARF